MPKGVRAGPVRWFVDQHRPGQFDPDYRRHWPRAHAGHIGKPVVLRILCDDPYVPEWVRDETHEPLTVQMTDCRGFRLGWRWVTVGTGFRTLAEAKRAGEEFYVFNEHLLDRSLQPS